MVDLSGGCPAPSGVTIVVTPRFHSWMATTTATAAMMASPRATKPRHGWFRRAGRVESAVTPSSLITRQQWPQCGSERVRILGPRQYHRASREAQRYLGELLRDRPATTEYPGADRGTDVVQFGDSVHRQRFAAL